MLSTQQNGSDRLATQQRQIQFEELSIASLQEAHLGWVNNCLIFYTFDNFH